MLYWFILLLGSALTATNVVFIARANSSPENRPPKWVFPVIPCVFNCIAIVHLMPISLERTVLYWIAITLELLIDIVYPHVFRSWFNGRTRLHRAVDRGDVQCIVKYISEGDDVNVMDNPGETPLMIAVRRKNLPLVKLLLSYGADPNMSIKTGVEYPMFAPPLDYASFSGVIGIVQMLVDAGAQVNNHNGNGSSALIKAIWQNHYDVVKLLVESGADITNPTYVSGKTALEYAKEQRNHKITSLLEQHLSP